MMMYINQLWEQECKSIGTAWIERGCKSHFFTMALSKHKYLCLWLLLKMNLQSIGHEKNVANQLAMRTLFFDQLWQCTLIICAESIDSSCPHDYGMVDKYCTIWSIDGMLQLELYPQTNRHKKFAMSVILILHHLMHAKWQSIFSVKDDMVLDYRAIHLND